MNGSRPGRLLAVVAAGIIFTAFNPPAARAGLLVTANDDAYTVAHDLVLTVAAPGVLANDTGIGLTAAKLSNPAHGSVTVDPNGSFTYRPSAGYFGSDTFTYEARVLNLLGIILDRDPATVTITVTAPSPTPTPTAAPTPTPTPTPAATTAPTPAPTPTPTPAPLPTSTLPPLPSLPIPTPTIPPLPSLPIPTPTLPLPTPTLPPLPGSSPTPVPSASPTPALGDRAAPTAPPPGSSPNPSPSDTTASVGSPGPSSGPGSGGGAGVAPSTPGPVDTSGFGIGDGPPAPFGLLDGGVGTFEGLEWAVPALFLTVPGLLIIAIAAQLFAGALWLPVARRWLGAFGVSRRRRREERTSS